jgi:hypothetical protein
MPEIPATSNGSLSLLISNRRCSNGMDQQQAGEEHYRAGHAMNGERCGLPPPARTLHCSAGLKIALYCFISDICSGA